MYIYLDLEVLNLPSYKHPSRSHDHRPVFNVKNNKQQTNTYTKTLKGTKADPKRREKIRLSYTVVLMTAFKQFTIKSMVTIQRPHSQLFNGQKTSPHTYFKVMYYV